MNLISSSTQFRVAARLHWRDWGEDVVVFNPDSGMTHLLNPVAAEVLATFTDGPSSHAGLMERLAALGIDTPRNDLAASIDVLLHQFDQLGLIEPA